MSITQFLSPFSRYFEFLWLPDITKTKKGVLENYSNLQYVVINIKIHYSVMQLYILQNSISCFLALSLALIFWRFWVHVRYDQLSGHLYFSI